MKQPKTRVITRAVLFAATVVALPIAFQGGDVDTDESLAIVVNGACAQSGGTCVPEYNSVCEQGGALHYHLYYDE